MKNAIGISTGNHYAFKRYIETLGIENISVLHMKKNDFILIKMFKIIKALLSIPRNHSHYICESCFYYLVFLKKIGLIKGKVVNVCSSPIYYNLLHNRVNFLSKKILLWLLRDVDFFICQGKYVEDILKKLNVNKPSMITYTFINPKRLEELDKIKPDLNSKTICCIATNDWYYKGVDILLESMLEVNKVNPEIKLNLVVRNIDLSKFKHLITSNINVREDAVQALSESSLYIHPARGDVFPVAPLEAMYIGLPVICSSECGTKELLDEENIFKLNKKEMADKILNKDKMKKKKLEIFEKEVLEKIKLF